MKLRIVAGKLGGRWFNTKGLKASTHPMSERVRGSLFNRLGDLRGKTVFDAFSGSGALAFEAVSRGATLVLATERDRGAQHVITENISALELETNVRLIKASCSAWSRTNPDVQFDLIVCDPPYHDLQLSTVSLLVRHLNSNGLMVLSHPGRESSPTVNGVVVVDSSTYGDAALAIYRKEGV